MVDDCWCQAGCVGLPRVPDDDTVTELTVLLIAAR